MLITCREYTPDKFWGRHQQPVQMLASYFEVIDTNPMLWGEIVVDKRPKVMFYRLLVCSKR